MSVNVNVEQITCSAGRGRYMGINGNTEKKNRLMCTGWETGNR